MEKYLCDGISRGEVERQFEKVYALKFPMTPSNECSDEICDMFSELVMIDMTIMGAVSTFLSGGETKLEYIKCDKDFEEMSNKIHSNNKSYREIIQYKNELDMLTALFRDL